MESISITINNLSKEAAAELLLKFCGGGKNKKVEKVKPVIEAAEKAPPEEELAEFDSASGTISNSDLLEKATKFINAAADPKEARLLIKKQLKKYAAPSMTSIPKENREEMMQFLSKPIKK